MASYKEAAERMAQTGNGLQGLEYTSFQEYIVKNICRYYFELDPILKDRPNVTPWATNEDTSDDDSKGTSEVEVEVEVERSNTSGRNSSVYLSSDNDSVSSSAHDMNVMECLDSDVEVVDMQPKKRSTSNISKRSSNSLRANHEYDSNSIDSPKTISTHTNSSHVSNRSYDYNSSDLNSSVDNISDVTIIMKDKMIGKKKNKKSSYTPSEAKQLQKNMTKIKKKRRTIAKKSGNDIISKYKSSEEEEREMLLETRDKQMMFQEKQHMDMKTLEKEKISIERERLSMEKNTMMLKHRTMETQNNLEMSKIVLVRLEMFERREKIKKTNPSVTEDYLNNHFPYPSQN